jgi:signal transduction histidine kinase/ActR/RegA family two-component response regulator
VRTLLVLSNQAHFAQAIQAVLEPARFQIIAKESVADAEFLLGRGAIDATILDADLAGSRTIRALEELKSCAPGSAVIIYTGDRQWQWEEDAYLLGVAHVLNKPVRGRLLNTLLTRLFPEAEPKTAILPAPRPEPGLARTGDGLRALEALRRFSNLFTHSLDAQALLKQFLLLLREVIGVNRAIIFLRKPGTRPADGPVAPDDRWLRSACAIGLDQAVLQHFGLSLNAGIGGHLHRHGRVLRAGSAEAVASREITKEFQLLGAQLAIPILDRESLLGVAVFDERLTGEPYVNEEISLIFHLLEEIGLALRNSWLHDQIVVSHSMIGDILGHLGSGAAVFGADLDTLHANAAARRIFLPAGSTKPQLEFSDLPQQLGSMVFTVIKSGAAVPAFKHVFPDKPGQIFSLEIVPFRAANGPNAALLLIEDVSEHERAQKLETEASNLRLVKSMAEHLAHEIGNALVPISTHQQLLKDQIGDPEFQESLDAALASGVKRIARLSSQMMFLAREWAGDFGHDVAIGDLIVEAFHEAHTFHPGKKIAQLSFNKKTAPWKVKADPKALRHAFSEIMLNALQANPENPVVSVNLEESKAGEPLLKVEVRDSGQGFTQEAAERAPEPFFSTRNVGLGIGLTVSRRIIENHRGKIEIAPSGAGESGLVRVSLPLGEPAANG